MIYVQVDTNGVVQSAGVSYVDPSELPAGLRVFPLNIPLSEVMGYALKLSTGTFLPTGARPGEFYNFNQASFSWLLDIPRYKAAKLTQLEQARDAAERANVTVTGKVFSASDSFQAKISRQLNQISRGKPLAGANDAWRTADMQPVVMTVTMLSLIEDAITAQGAAAWVRFWLRFDVVQSATTTTTAAIDAVVW